VKCQLCEREAADGLCQYHSEARKKVEENYAYWREAYGTLAWAEYLDMIKRNPETGQWAKEAARHLGDESDKKGS